MNILNENKITPKVKATYSQSSFDKSEDTNQDVLFISDEEKLNRTFCVVDGVSNASDPKEWAIFLANMSESTNSKKENFLQLFFDKREDYLKNWKERKIKFIKENAHRWWFTPEEIEKPSAASYCSITIKNRKENSVKFSALAMGDSCYIHLDKDLKLKSSFPISNSEDFDNQLSIYTDATLKGFNNSEYGLKEQTFEAEKGDIIILATDAFAKWILRQSEQSNIEYLKQNFLNICHDYNEVEKLISNERKKANLEDDDTTFIVIQV